MSLDSVRLAPMANAIRALLRVAAERKGQQVTLDALEP